MTPEERMRAVLERHVQPAAALPRERPPRPPRKTSGLRAVLAADPSKPKTPADSHCPGCGTRVPLLDRSDPEGAPRCARCVREAS